MPKPSNRTDVDALKRLFAAAWTRILADSPDERVYAAGFYTNESGQYFFPFVMSEQGLAKAAQKYVDKGIYPANKAADNLRWSTADSPYTNALSKTVHDFDGRPDLYELSPTAAARESRYRLTAARDALRELDAEGLFGTGGARDRITLYLEGGDVNREWLLTHAKPLNPKPVYDHFAKLGAPDETAGTFTEFGTKKVYETDAYAVTADRTRIAAATQYQLFLFDTAGPKQLYAKALPTKDDYSALGDVAMSADGAIIAVIPFGGGRHETSLFLVRGAKGEDVQTVGLPARPMALAVDPAGDWIAVTDENGSLHRYAPDGTPLGTSDGHAYWPRGVAVSPDGATLATADSRTLVFWNTRDWTKRHTLTLPVDGVDFDPTGRFVACACRYAPRDADEPKAAFLVDARTGEVAREVAADGYRVHIAKFSPDGRSLACAVRDDTDGYAGTNTALLIDVASGSVVSRLKADFEQIRDFVFLPERGEIGVAVFGHTRRPLVLWTP